MKPDSTVSIQIHRFENGSTQKQNDVLAIEEPLEIKMKYSLDGISTEKNISVTMRTPGNDSELASGFLFTEGIIKPQLGGILSDNTLVVSITPTLSVIPPA